MKSSASFCSIVLQKMPIDVNQHSRESMSYELGLNKSQLFSHGNVTFWACVWPVHVLKLWHDEYIPMDKLIQHGQCFLIKMSSEDLFFILAHFESRKSEMRIYSFSKKRKEIRRSKPSHKIIYRFCIDLYCAKFQTLHMWANITYKANLLYIHLKKITNSVKIWNVAEIPNCSSESSRTSDDGTGHLLPD